MFSRLLRRRLTYCFMTKLKSCWLRTCFLNLLRRIVYEKSNLQNTKISITDNKHRYLNTDNKQQIKERAKRFTIPTLEEIQNYCNERQNRINPEYFLDYYTARDWKFNNGGKMKDWKATIRNWERLERNREQNKKSVFDENKLTFD